MSIIICIEIYFFMDREITAKEFEDFGIELCGSERGWQIKYAKMLGIARSQVSNIINGRESIGSKMLMRMEMIGYKDSGKTTVKKLTDENNARIKQLENEIKELKAENRRLHSVITTITSATTKLETIKKGIKV